LAWWVRGDRNNKTLGIWLKVMVALLEKPLKVEINSVAYLKRRAPQKKKFVARKKCTTKLLKFCGELKKSELRLSVTNIEILWYRHKFFIQIFKF
jgi:hypothetical protein